MSTAAASVAFAVLRDLQSGRRKSTWPAPDFVANILSEPHGAFP